MPPKRMQADTGDESQPDADDFSGDDPFKCAALKREHMDAALM